jgi:hypothetical protein
METNKLPKEDLALIAQIDARLKHYNLIDPIEQVEQPKEEVKEWYNVTVHPFKHNINDNRITIYYNDGELSTQQANVLVTQIKALLQTL